MATLLCLAAMLPVGGVLSPSRAVAADAVTRVEQTDTRLVYAGSWSTFSTASASGGSYKRASTDGSSVTVTFNGTYLAWIATEGTTLGKAFVSLDGGATVSVDLARSSVAYQQNVWNTGTLASGTHTVKIWRDPGSASGKYISIDAVEVAGSLVSTSTTRIEQTDSKLAYVGSWLSSTQSQASGGSYKYIDSSGAVTVTFDGTYLAWIATKSSVYGKAKVTLDSKSPVTVDLYSSSTLYRQEVWNTGTLSSGTHTVKIEWTGTKNSSATATRVSIDAFDVVGSLLAATPATVTGSFVCNVMNYGAKGDGVTDDAPAVQAAVDAANAAGGGTVYLPAGHYRFAKGRSLDPSLGANIEVLDNVTVQGAGADKTFVVGDLAWASVFGGFRRTNAGVRDMDVTVKSSAQDGLKFGVCTSTVIQNVVVHDIYIGIAMYSCTNPVVQSCKAYNCNIGIWVGPGSTWSDSGSGGLIQDCEGYGTNVQSFRVAGRIGTSPLRISGVVLRRCYAHASGSTTGFLLSYAANLTLDTCTSSTTGYTGIHIAGVNGATLSRCTTPFVSTATNDPNMYAQYGSSSKIVVQ